jgi:predicted N-acetyltransferase YhbS
MKYKINYKRATIKDFFSIVNLCLLLYGNDIKKNDAEMSVKKAIKEKLVWVAKKDKEIVGYVSCELFDEKHYMFPNSIFISELYVSEKYRKQGIGKELVDLVISDQYPSGFKYFSVTHDPKEKFLTKFYESLGFKKQGCTDAGNIKLIKLRK